MFLTHRRCKVEGKRKTIAGSSLRDQQCGTSTTAIWLHACIIVVHLQVQLKFSLQVHHTFHRMNTPTAAALQGIALALAPSPLTPSPGDSLGQVGGCRLLGNVSDTTSGSQSRLGITLTRNEMH